MNTNEDIRNETPEYVIELGVASVETKGPSGVIEPDMGPGGTTIPGISEE